MRRRRDWKQGSEHSQRAVSICHGFCCASTLTTVKPFRTSLGSNPAPYCRGTPVAFPWIEASRTSRPSRLTIHAGFIKSMSNLPKYYFGDIPAVVMAEIMDEMLRLKPEPELSDLEEVDDWLNRSNRPRTIPGWYESVGEYLSDVRAEYK